MDNKKFLIEFEVEAHACLNEQTEKICSEQPQGGFEIHLSNLAVKRGTDRPLLSVQIIVPGNDIKEVKKIGTEKLKEYLDYLTLVTNHSYQLHKIVRVIDWTTGLKMRDCLQFERFPGYDIPFPVLDEQHFKTIEILQKANISAPIKRALRWFANGVSSKNLDDQFQYFWFVLEILAQLTKKLDKVNDLCPRCHKPLYCESCQTHPTHRPYPKQAIKQLIENSTNNAPDGLFEIISTIRNAIMHGDPIEKIEESNNVKLSDLVDTIGHLAWVAILNIFITSFEEPLGDVQLTLIETNMYSHQVLNVTAHIVVYSSNPDEPKLSELARPRINLVFPEEGEKKT
ncbi:MAG: methylamine utilization protein MauJ [Thermodesulfobacteriota bacterium]